MKKTNPKAKRKASNGIKPVVRRRFFDESMGRIAGFLKMNPNKSKTYKQAAKEIDQIMNFIVLDRKKYRKGFEQSVKKFSS